MRPTPGAFLTLGDFFFNHNTPPPPCWVEIHLPECLLSRPPPEQVVDEASLLMWMLGQCSGTTPIWVRGPSGPRARAQRPLRPLVQVYHTQYGGVTQVVIPPAIYETAQALGYHHVGVCTR